VRGRASQLCVAPSDSAASHARTVVPSDSSLADPELNARCAAIARGSGACSGGAASIGSLPCASDADGRVGGGGIAASRSSAVIRRFGASSQRAHSSRGLGAFGAPSRRAATPSRKYVSGVAGQRAQVASSASSLHAPRSTASHATHSPASSRTIGWSSTIISTERISNRAVARSPRAAASRAVVITSASPSGIRTSRLRVTHTSPVPVGRVVSAQAAATRPYAVGSLPGRLAQPR